MAGRDSAAESGQAVALGCRGCRRLTNLFHDFRFELGVWAVAVSAHLEEAGFVVGS